VDDHSTKKAQIIQLNESAVRDHLGEMVRNTVEEGITSNLSTSANGEIIAALAGLNTMAVSLTGTSALREGHGKITGTVASGAGNGFLVATCIMRDSDPRNSAVVWNYSIPINGSNPF